MRCTLSAAVALLAGLVPAGRPALADPIPADTVVICGVTTVTTAPSQTVYGCAFNNSGATYDLKSGQFSVGAGPTGDAELITRDVFLVSGPSSSTPIPFNAQLAVHVGRTYDGRAIASISSDDLGQDFTSNGSWVGSDFYQILTVPLSHTTGDHFHLAFRLRAINPDVGAIGPATASARLVFAVPPGYMVTSSQGYSSVTPTRATTWGHLKVIYR